MKKKYIFPIIMVLSIVWVISGCQSKDDSDTTDSNNGQINLTMITLSAYEETLSQIIDDYKADNPNVNIEIKGFPSDDMRKQQQTVLNAKDSDTDIVFVDGPEIAEYVARGWVEPLGDLLDTNFEEKWISPMVEQVTHNDKIITAPISSSSNVLYYNKDILSESEIAFPENDFDQRLTWEELVEGAKKVEGDNNWGFAFEQPNKSYQMITLGQSMGQTDLVSEDGLTATGYVNSDIMVKAGEFYSNLYNEWGITPKPTSDRMTDYFTSDRLAFFIGTERQAKIFDEAGVNYGIAPLPYFSDGQPVTPTGSWTIGVSKFSKNKEEAAKIIEYITANEGSITWFEKEAKLPATVELYEDIQESDEYNELPDSVLKLALKENQETAVLRPKTPGYISWASEVDAAFQNIMNGTDPKEALDEAAKRIDKELEKFQ